MRRTMILTMLALVATTVLAAPAAGARTRVPANGAQSQGSGFFLTIAARYCRNYEDITANLARNNIQESLQDLGKDTAYQSGESIRPSIEDANQPNCTPLPDWGFTLGTNYRTKAVTGPWGALSIVTGAYAGTPTTKAETPLLNDIAQDTGQTIKGAVTIELTRAQADRAARPNSLWIQGGTPTDPILNGRFPGQYGFGALRCSIDNLNGDNVEWVSYPQGATHVFCYAYYVKPPPTSGTIIVRKRVDAPAGTDRQRFRFEGNISYTEDKAFNLDAAPGQDGSTTFYRSEVGGANGVAEPWNFTEVVPPGWDLAGVGCVSATSQSRFTIDQSTGRTEVTLAAGDTVTCVYLNRLRPPPAGLELFKTTIGNVGRFGFNVTGPQSASATAQTTERGVPTAADPARLELPAGTYEVRETLRPISTSGTWRLTEVRCNGEVIEDDDPLRLNLVSGQGQACVYTNTFVPNGSIKLRKLTRGGVGTTGFVITQVENPARQLRQSATTTAEGVPVLATGDPSGRLPLGRYVIQETTPSEPADGAWTLDSLLCDGIPVPTAQGKTTIELTSENPSIDCTFSDSFARGGTSGGGGGDTGGGGGGGGDTGGSGNVVNPQTDLSITKTVAPKVINRGALATYAIVVRNTSTVTARDVTVAEQRGTRTDGVRLTTTKGTCLATNPAVCRLGTLKAGEQVRITARVRPQRAPVRYRNVVAVNTSTAERDKRDNRAAAVLIIRAKPRFVG